MAKVSRDWELLGLGGIALLAVALTVGSAASGAATNLPQDVVAIVRVFSDGEEVARYQATSIRQAPLGCAAFEVRDGVRQLERQVCMDHIIEWVR